MQFVGIPNMGTTADGRPLIIDESIDKGTKGTVLNSSFFTPMAQELYNVIVMSGMTPSGDNTQIFQIINGIRSSLNSLQSVVSQFYKDSSNISQVISQQVSQGLSSVDGSISKIQDDLNTAVNNMNTALNNSIAALQSSLNRVESDSKNGINGVESDLNSKVSSLSTTINALQTALNNAVSSLNNSISSADNSIAGLQSSIGGLVSGVAQPSSGSSATSVSSLIISNGAPYITDVNGTTYAVPMGSFLSTKTGGTVNGTTSFNNDLYIGVPYSGGGNATSINFSVNSLNISLNSDNFSVLSFAVTIKSEEDLQIGVSGSSSVNGTDVLWKLTSQGVITTPRNTQYIEAIESIGANSGHPVTVQRFRVNAANGYNITFPKPFANDDVTVIVPSYYTPGSLRFIVAGPTLQFPVTRNGFVMSKAAISPQGPLAWDNSAELMWVIAIGQCP